MLTSKPVSLWLGAAGYCTHPEFLTIRGGSLKSAVFPAGFACIRHPEYGVILFDTGYSSRFFDETRSLPQALYRYITPVVYHEEQSAVQQLSAADIDAEDVQYIILSHFHGDHIAAVQDFPNAQFIYMQESYDAVRRLGTLAAVKAGFLQGLLPQDFAERSHPFTRSSRIEGNRAETAAEAPAVNVSSAADYAPYYDLFGDGSILAIELSGHAEGMISLLLSTAAHDYLLCADTVWSSRAFKENRAPHPAAGLIMSNRREYKYNMERLRQWSMRHPQLRIVPSHCNEALAAWGGRWLG